MGQVGAPQFSMGSLAPDVASPTLATGVRDGSLRPCTEHRLVLVCPGVMPPDEYHSGVNNSVYTNVLVQNRSDPRPLPELPPCKGLAGPAGARVPLSLPPPLACALLLPWPRTWVSPSPASGWQWLIRSRFPLTRGGTSTLSLMGTSLVSVLGAASGPLHPSHRTCVHPGCPLPDRAAPPFRLPPPRQQHLSLPRRGGEAGRCCAPGVPHPFPPESSHPQEEPGDL